MINWPWRRNVQLKKEVKNTVSFLNFENYNDKVANGFEMKCTGKGDKTLHFSVSENVTPYVPDLQ